MLSTAFGYGRPARLAARFAFAFCRTDSGLASPVGRGRFQIGFRVRLCGARAISAVLPDLSSQPCVRAFFGPSFGAILRNLGRGTPPEEKEVMELHDVSSLAEPRGRLV